MTGNGETGINKFGSTVTLDTFNNRVFNHQVFGLSKRFTIPANGVVDIVIDPTEKGTFPKNTFVMLPLSINTSGAGPVEVDIYAGTDSDQDGTLWDSTDRNFDTPLTAHTTIRFNPTISTIGTKSPTEYCIYSVAGQGNTADVGGSVKTDLITVPRKDIRYTIQLTNTDSSNEARGVFTFDWFEV